MSVLIDIADAATAILQGASLSLPFAAARGYVVTRDISALDGIVVTVIPGPSEGISAFDLNGRLEYTPEVMVWLQSKATPTPQDCDPLVDLAEEIAGLFKPGRSLPGTEFRVIGLEFRPTFDPERLDTQRIFASGLAISFRLTR